MSDINQRLDIERIKQLWPHARHIRFEGKCPICGQQTLYTFVTANRAVRVDGMEYCAERCQSCLVVGTGLRKVQP